MFSAQRRQISKMCDTPLEYRAFHHCWWFQKLVPMQKKVCK